MDEESINAQLQVVAGEPEPSHKPRANGGNGVAKVGDLPDIHRLLPQSPDGEKALLGSMFVLPDEVCSLCMEKNVTQDWFHIPAHAVIYSAVLEMWDQRKPINFMTVTHHLHVSNLLQAAGGAPFITDVSNFLPTAANAGYYIEILKDKFLFRKGITITTEYAARGYDQGEGAEEYLDELEQKILAIRQSCSSGNIPPTSTVVMQALNGLQEIIDRKGAIGGISTGFYDLDRMIDGLHPDELTIIAARPSMGKTALAMNIAEHIAVDQGRPVAVFSLEMSAKQLMQRILCSRGRVNWMRLRDGKPTATDIQNMQRAAADISDKTLIIDDTPGMTIQEIRGKSRRLQKQFDIQAIFVDYLQLGRSSTKRAQENRQILVADISYGLKMIARELHIPVLALAQINRNAEERAGANRGRPMLKDLRESGAIEQDADNVGLLYRPEEYEDDVEKKEELRGQAELIIAKQRNGPVGEVPLAFIKQFTRFESRSTRVDEDPALGI